MAAWGLEGEKGSDLAMFGEDEKRQWARDMADEGGERGFGGRGKGVEELSRRNVENGI